MAYDKALIAGKLRRWEKYLETYHLPRWEEIPDLGLYMEQVIALLQKYLDYLPPEIKEEQFITASTINNYVRTKLMPEPVKKRYYRVHIVYLIVILTLKQALSLALVQKILPLGVPEEELHTAYDAYVERHRKCAKYFIEQVRVIAGPILDHEDTGATMATADPAALIVSSAVIGNFSRLLAEKLLLLEGKDLTDGGSIEIVEKPR